ncbi:Uncharacterised protein [Mycobacteroides abscessus subsp. abscessus]|uniref:hypothetical protein n=1 Tax=Mycobacteroides abscessus TaxID=36809 RepID=UPI0009A75E23|nr:hypothetical protein [Mycobacteroides abscessus]SLI30185.1 Uncharacterised protein [Mycobacteroides abscessus subsp. abscessus]
MTSMPSSDRGQRREPGCSATVGAAAGAITVGLVVLMSGIVAAFILGQRMLEMLNPTSMPLLDRPLSEWVVWYGFMPICAVLSAIIAFHAAALAGRLLVAIQQPPKNPARG